MNAADVIEYARTQTGHVANGDLDAAYLSGVVPDLLALAEEQAATIARVRELADGDHTHASLVWCARGTFQEGHLCAMADLRSALDGGQP